MASDKEARRYLKGLVDRIPRIPLAHLPTPLDHCPRLSQRLGGPQIYIKRDDCTGLAFGGNKTRQLEFIMAEAQRKGADTIITGASTQSNLCRQTVAACRRLGMKPYLILLHGVKGPLMQGNLLLDHLLGAEVTIIEGEDFSVLPPLFQQKAEDLRRQGRKPYVFDPFNDTTSLAAVAYVDAFVELSDQLEERELEMDYLYLSAFNITPAGLALAAKFLGSEVNIVGITPARAPEDRPTDIARIANSTARLLGLEVSLKPQEIVNYDDWVGEKYGVPTPEGMEAIKLVASAEGILLDPVYTGKAMAGLIDHIRWGLVNRGATVVFLHTGGTPALFAYSSDLRLPSPQ